MWIITALKINNEPTINYIMSPVKEGIKDVIIMDNGRFSSINNYR